MIEGSFCTAVGFQYQRGPRIGILIKGGVSNKGGLSVKYGVRVRHTTTAISARIKKAAQTKEGSFSWTKDRPLPYIHGRKKQRKEVNSWLTGTGQELRLVVGGWKMPADAPKCMRKHCPSEKCAFSKSNIFINIHAIFTAQGPKL